MLVGPGLQEDLLDIIQFQRVLPRQRRQLILQLLKHAIFVWLSDHHSVLIRDDLPIIFVATLIQGNCHYLKIHLLFESLRVILGHVFLLWDEVFVPPLLDLLAQLLQSRKWPFAE